MKERFDMADTSDEKFSRTRFGYFIQEQERSDIAIATRWEFLIQIFAPGSHVGGLADEWLAKPMKRITGSTFLDRTGRERFLRLLPQFCDLCLLPRHDYFYSYWIELHEDVERLFIDVHIEREPASGERWYSSVPTFAVLRPFSDHGGPLTVCWSCLLALDLQYCHLPICEVTLTKKNNPVSQQNQVRKLSAVGEQSQFIAERTTRGLVSLQSPNCVEWNIDFLRKSEVDVNT